MIGRNGKKELSRRQMLGYVGSAAAATALAACGSRQTGSRSGPTSAGGAATTTAGGIEAGTTQAAMPSCVLTPEATEGPYYLDLTRIRKDITEGKAGVPLRLSTMVVDTADGCRPLRNVAVDIWHCDAVGVYSGFTEASNQQGGSPPAGGDQYGTPPPPPEQGGPEAGNEPTDDTTFLRGVQLTDEDGVAEFDTIYPGWYQGRALHIHLKVIVDGRVSGNTYEGGHVSHTGQLFFPEDVTEKVATLEPYSVHGDVPIVPQARDGIFEQAGGDGAVVDLTPLGGAIEDGFTAEITLGVDPNAAPAGMGAGPTPGVAEGAQY